MSTRLILPASKSLRWSACLWFVCVLSSLAHAAPTEFFPTLGNATTITEATINTSDTAPTPPPSVTSCSELNWQSHNRCL